MPGGTRPFGPMMAPAAITATGDHVYVLRGNTLYQFSAKDLKLLHKVALEDERPGMPGGFGGGGLGGGGFGGRGRGGGFGGGGLGGPAPGGNR